MLQYITNLTGWDGAGLSTWEGGSKVFEALTSKKESRTPKELGAVVQGAMALLVSAVALENTPYETTREVFTAAMTMEGKHGGETDSGVPFPWLKITIPLTERSQVVLESVDNMANASV